MVRIVIRFITHILLPFSIAAIIFYFTKPSDEKCKKEVIEKLATINIKASEGDILVRDRIFVKSIRYMAKNDTTSFGFGALFSVRISEVKLKNVRELHSANHP